jgi:hypothetical protein
MRLSFICETKGRVRLGATAEERSQNYGSFIVGQVPPEILKQTNNLVAVLAITHNKCAQSKSGRSIMVG